MNSDKIYDIIGIGIGPFNLGLAALAADIAKLECIFIDRNEQFSWHPGMMLPTAKMQVPFYADLVTLANPCSRFSYVNYLKSTGKLFKFAVNETYYPYRSEFNAYCQWVVSQLNNLHFGYTCTDIRFDEKTKIYRMSLISDTCGQVQELHGKHIVLGTGSVPALPACAENYKHPLLFHSSEYLFRKHAALVNKRIVIIGSGQSAAEIFLDLLPHMRNLDSLSWITRSDRFHPMDYSKLTLEMSSPDYIQYFYSLNSSRKKRILQEQQYLYKGINTQLIQEIYQQIYLMDLDKNTTLPQFMTNSQLRDIQIVDYQELRLKLENTETGIALNHSADVVILATGYHYKIPGFLEGLKKDIDLTDNWPFNIHSDYSIDENETVFVQNVDEHTHGFNSADIGLGPYRNAVILNAILKYEYFKIEKNLTFQKFSHSA